MLLDLLDSSIKRTFNASTTLNLRELQIFDFIADWREQNGYSTSKSHFLRQLIHYGLNGGDKEFIMKLPKKNEIDEFLESLIQLEE